MQLEQQVVSLELSQKLKELGVMQESCFAFVNTKQGGKIHLLTTFNPYMGEENFISTYTVAELGEMLPEKVGDNKYHLHIYRHPDFLKENNYERKEGWSCGYEIYNWDQQKLRHYWGGWLFWEHSDTLANTMATMLIYLIENNLLKPCPNQTNQ